MQCSNFFVAIFFVILIGHIDEQEFQVECFRLDHKEDCVVEDTNQNTYIGRKKLSMLNNVPFCSYLGIPYAEPPTGHRRFKDPIAVQLWGEEREARMEGSECMQSEPLFNMGKVIGSEDCLYLNVYTQYSSNSSLPGKLKAVMVWIHGGGFVFGSGSPSIYGPDFLIQHNIVLVTFNYRLGAFDLFHRVIMQSGSVYCPWTFIRDPLDRANQLGSHLQINTTDPIKLAQGLRNVSSYQLTLAQSQLSTNQAISRELV